MAIRTRKLQYFSSWNVPLSFPTSHLQRPFFLLESLPLSVHVRLVPRPQGLDLPSHVGQGAAPPGLRVGQPGPLGLEVRKGLGERRAGLVEEGVLMGRIRDRNEGL